MEEQQAPSAMPPSTAHKSRALWIVIAVVVVVAVVLSAAAFAGLFRPAQTMRIGLAIPLTGTLELFGPGMQMGATLAAEQINAAGGVLGRQIEIVVCDSQTRAAAGANCAANLIFTQGVVAIIGAASSGVSQAMSPLTIENEIVQMSPASTSPLFSTFEIDGALAVDPDATVVPDRDEPGWFWRTAPSDTLQGTVAAVKAADNPAWLRVGIIAVNTPYGKGFADVFRSAFAREAPGAQIVVQVNYTEEQPTYDSELQLIAAADPDMLLAVAFPGDGLKMMQTWWENRAQPGWDWEWLWAEGLKADAFLGQLDEAGVDVAGIEGTAPTFTGGGFQAFNTSYRARFGANAAPQVFDGNTYDAVYLIALAAQAGGSANSDTIRRNLDAVSRSGTAFGPGEWTEAVAAIAAGTDINYEGASGPVDFDVVGDVVGDYEIWRIEGTLAAGFRFVRVQEIPWEDLV